jgi:hypothetical protein
MVNESCVGEALSQLEARAFHKMKMKPRIVATAIPRTNGKWAGSKNSGYMKLSSARLRPLRALVAAIEQLASWEWPQSFFLSAATNPYHIFLSSPG